MPVWKSNAVNLNVDLSHWACVSEQCWDVTSDNVRAKWFKGLMDNIKDDVRMIHARVGHDQGSQVDDPRWDCWVVEVERHLDWWRICFEGMKNKGRETCWVTAEFGPEPYMRRRKDGGDVADLDEVNLWISGRVREAFIEGGYGDVEGDWSNFAYPTLQDDGMKVVNKEDIKGVLTTEDVMESAKQAFTALSEGTVTSPVPVQLDFPGRGETCVKPGWVHESDYYVVKVASGFQANADKGLPTGNGCVVVFSSVTGGPVAVMRDEGYLTDFRTAAAAVLGGVEAGGDRVKGGNIKVAIVGGGAVGKLIAKTACEVMGVGEIKCWSRNIENAEGLREVLGEGVGFRACGTVEDTVKVRGRTREGERGEERRDEWRRMSVLRAGGMLLLLSLRSSRPSPLARPQLTTAFPPLRIVT